MKGLLISALATAMIGLGWSAVSTTPAKAYPKCVYPYGSSYAYCLSSYWYDGYWSYYGHHYPYCIKDYGYFYCHGHPSSGGGGSSGY